jgi:quinol monooxygenase YgiN
MFMNRNEAEVTIGRSAEFEATIDEWAAIQAQNAGFVGATLLQSYGNPGRHTLISRWVDREASLAAGRREEFVQFAQRFLSSGLARPTRLTESYESVFEVDRDSANANASTVERLAELTLTTPMVAPAFEDAIRQMAELGRQHAQGVISVRLRRSLGVDTRYLMITIVTDHAAARGLLLVPQIRAWMEAQPLGSYLAQPPSSEIHAVVKRYAGPALAAVEPTAAVARAT